MVRPAPARNEASRPRAVRRGAVDETRPSCRSTSRCRNGASRPSPVALLIASLHVQYRRKRRRRSSGVRLGDRRAAPAGSGTSAPGGRTRPRGRRARHRRRCAALRPVVRQRPISATLPVCETLKSSPLSMPPSSGRPRRPRAMGTRRALCQAPPRAPSAVTRVPRSSAPARRRFRSARRARALRDASVAASRSTSAAGRSRSHQQSETSSATARELARLVAASMRR